MASLGPWMGGRGRGAQRGRWDPWFSSPFSSDIWDVNSFGNIPPAAYDNDTAAIAHAHVDWRETSDAHIFRADLPGVRKEEVKVQVEDGNILQISGERSKEEEDSNDKWHRVERRRGSFVRRFRLPENANVEDVKCWLQDGVLNVTVPKKKNIDSPPQNVRYIDVA